MVKEMNIKLDIISEEDIELLRKWRMSPEVTRYMFTDPIITIEQQRKWYQAICNNKEDYYWIIKCNDIRIGYISITNIDRENKSCEIGHYIGETSYLRKGISKIIESNVYDFVFEKLKLETIVFMMLKENEAAYCLHQSLGAVNYETDVKECIKNEKRYEVIALCMTKDIWSKQDSVYSKIIINTQDDRRI